MFAFLQIGNKSFTSLLLILHSIFLSFLAMGTMETGAGKIDLLLHHYGSYIIIKNNPKNDFFFKVYDI